MRHTINNDTMNTRPLQVMLVMAIVALLFTLDGCTHKPESAYVDSTQSIVADTINSTQEATVEGPYHYSRNQTGRTDSTILYYRGKALVGNTISVLFTRVAPDLGVDPYSLRDTVWVDNFGKITIHNEDSRRFIIVRRITSDKAK